MYLKKSGESKQSKSIVGQYARRKNLQGITGEKVASH